MALKRKNTEFVQLKKGDKVSGYLVSVGMQLFPSKIPGNAPSEVPTMVLQREDGSKYKVLLGTTVKEDVGLLNLNVWTVVEKAKEAKTTRGGNNVIEYSLLQDDEKLLTA